MNDNIIPKLIHYIWLGHEKMPNYMFDFINSAKSLLNGYKFIIWHDEDVVSFYDKSTYILDAIKNNQYAFLSDYLRLYILRKYGGIYLDTDVCVKKRFDRFLKHKLVLGNIVDSSIGTAFIASCPNNPELNKWIDYMENQYIENKRFISNNHWMTQFFLENYDDFILNGKRQKLKNGIVIFPKTFFESAKPFYILKGGYTIHFCAGSWIKASYFQQKEVKKIDNSFLRNLFKKIYYSSFVFKQKNYRLHIKENRKYPFYNVFLEQKGVKSSNVKNKH